MGYLAAECCIIFDATAKLAKLIFQISLILLLSGQSGFIAKRIQTWL
jgi:hypothetical protein